MGIVKRYEYHPKVVHESDRHKKRQLLRKSPADSTARYMEEADQYELLTADDEKYLFSDIEHGLQVYRSLGSRESLSDQEEEALLNVAIAYQILYKSNTKLVISIAEKYKKYSVPFLDLIQEGNIGLSKAITRFDITMGYKFSTYATQWIEAGITRSLADKSRTIRLPAHLHEKWLKLNRTRVNLAQKLEREPTAGEIAEVMGMSAKQIEDLRRNGALSLKSLNEPLGDKEDREMGDLIVDPDSMDSAIDNLSNRQHLMEILVAAPLEPREIAVLCLRHGVHLEVFDDLMVQARDGQRSYEELMHNMPTTDGLTLDTIGELFGVTRERIRQIEGKALEKVRISLDLEEENL